MAALARVHAFGLDDGSGGGRRQIADEGLCGLGVLAISGDGGCEDQLLLQFSGEWAGQFDTGGDQHADKKYPEIGLTLGDCLSDLGKSGLRLGLGSRRPNTLKT